MRGSTINCSSVWNVTIIPEAVTLTKFQSFIIRLLKIEPREQFHYSMDVRSDRGIGQAIPGDIFVSPDNDMFMVVGRVYTHELNVRSLNPSRRPLKNFTGLWHLYGSTFNEES